MKWFLNSTFTLWSNLTWVEFLRSDLPVSEQSRTEKFIVKLDVSNLSQEYFVIAGSKIKVNNPDNLDYSVSGLNKSVMIVGSEKALESITEDEVRNIISDY